MILKVVDACSGMLQRLCHDDMAAVGIRLSRIWLDNSCRDLLAADCIQE